MTPLISIIIPTFNRAHIIGDTLESLIAQTYTNWECIVVDDCSTDKTEQLITSYINKDNRFRFYKRPTNRLKGPNSCRNIGFTKSKGDFIQWFDSDDLYKTNALEKLLFYFDKGKDAVVAKIERRNLVTNALMKPNTIVSENVITDYFTGNITYYVCGPMWRRSFLDKQSQLFDEAIGNLDDWDFNLRMLYAKPKIKYIDDAFIIYRMHDHSFSKELKKTNMQEIKSDLSARDKHIAILKEQQSVVHLQHFILDRTKLFYKTAMRNNRKGTSYLLKKLLQRQFVLRKYGAMIKSIFVHLVYKLTGKGDLWLK